MLPIPVSSSFLALLVNLDLSFAYSDVLPVLWKVCRPANTFPTRSLSGVCLSVSLAHINMPLSLPLCCLSSPLTQPPLWRQLTFLFSSGVLLACVLSKCCQLSPLSPGPWLAFPQRPSCSCFSFSLSFDPFCHFFFFSRSLSSSIISCPLLYLAFSCPVLSFTHSSHLLFLHPVPFLFPSSPHRTKKEKKEKQTHSSNTNAL